MDALPAAVGPVILARHRVELAGSEALVVLDFSHRRSVERHGTVRTAFCRRAKVVPTRPGAPHATGRVADDRLRGPFGSGDGRDCLPRLSSARTRDCV